MIGTWTYGELSVSWWWVSSCSQCCCSGKWDGKSCILRVSLQRMVVNYVELNEQMTTNVTSLLHFEELIVRLSNAKVFPTLDLTNGFHQITSRCCICSKGIRHSRLMVEEPDGPTAASWLICYTRDVTYGWTRWDCVNKVAHRDESVAVSTGLTDSIRFSHCSTMNA